MNHCLRHLTMKLFVVLFCATLKLSICHGGGEPAIKKLEKSSGSLQISDVKATDQSVDLVSLIKRTGMTMSNSNSVDITKKSHMREGDEGSVKAKEYIFLSEYEARVRIIDANTYELISRYESLPELQYSIGAIINDTFYRIDSTNGIIDKTDVGNLVSGVNPVPWRNVTAFQGAPSWARNNGVAINGTIIYFVNYHGVLYSFDIDSTEVSEEGAISFPYVDNYPSVIIVDGILFFQRTTDFYSYDGNAIKQIDTPEITNRPGLFESEGKVCRFGGNLTERYPNPVDCYDPKTDTWSTLVEIDEIRIDSGSATTQSGKVHFFGGFKTDDQGYYEWVNSSVVYDPSTNGWSYISPNVFDKPPQFVQAITFFN